MIPGFGRSEVVIIYPDEWNKGAGDFRSFSIATAFSQAAQAE
jgi:hypothetical protein